MNKHISLVKKWLNDPDSVSRKELKDNGDAAHAAARDADTDAEFHEAFTKEVFKHFGWSYSNKKYSCVKKKTKPFGSNPRIIQRNKDIQEEYYKLREEQGYTAKKAKEMLAEKYELAFSTIISIVKKNINELVKS